MEWQNFIFLLLHWIDLLLFILIEKNRISFPLGYNILFILFIYPENIIRKTLKKSLKSLLTLSKHRN